MAQEMAPNSSCVAFQQFLRLGRDPKACIYRKCRCAPCLGGEIRNLIRWGPNHATDYVIDLRKNSIDGGKVDSYVMRRVVEYLLDCYEKAFECAEDEKTKVLALQEETPSCKSTPRQLVNN